MSPGRRTKEEKTRARLLDLWRGEESFGRPLGCVATTFTFDAALFEEQCLARFLSIQSNPNETAKAYLIEREEKLSQCFAAVLVDASHAAPKRSLRWHQLAVSLPGAGSQHAKLSLLVWERRIRLMVGSANLTEFGYRKNQEHISVLEFHADGGPLLELLSQAVSFVRRIRAFAAGQGRAEGPQVALESFLRAIEAQTQLWTPPTPPADEPRCALVPLVPDAEQDGNSVLDLLTGVWRGPKPSEAWVLSPFFDEGADATEAGRKLASVLTPQGSRTVTFLAPGRRLADGTVEVDLPETLKASGHSAIRHEIGIVLEQVGEGPDSVRRPLHAKSLWLARDQEALYMVGSTNFTRAGLGLHPRHNIELNVAYLMRDSTSPFGRLCDSAYPEYEVLKDLSRARFVATTAQSDDASAQLPQLPRGFGLALFKLAPSGGEVELEIARGVPDDFSVRTMSGERVLDAPEWERLGHPKLVTVAWRESRAPSALQVTWKGPEDANLTAFWVVNVADASMLPPPEELCQLTLAELIEVLTSSRPLHEVVGQILERRERREEATAAAALFDPHKKVDTSGHLLRRMRRVADALEGLRERLEQPVFSLEALRWRLSGPVGPLVLATRLMHEEPESGSFMVAEVAATLSEVRWSPGGSLTSGEVLEEQRKVLQELLRLATARAGGSDSLSAYVNTTFRELAA